MFMNDDSRARLKRLCQQIAESPDGAAFQENLEKLSAFLWEMERAVQPADKLPGRARIPGAN